MRMRYLLEPRKCSIASTAAVKNWFDAKRFGQRNYAVFACAGRAEILARPIDIGSASASVSFELAC